MSERLRRVCQTSSGRVARPDPLILTAEVENPRCVPPDTSSRSLPATSRTAPATGLEVEAHDRTCESVVAFPGVDRREQEERRSRHQNPAQSPDSGTTSDARRRAPEPEEPGRKRPARERDTRCDHQRAWTRTVLHPVLVERNAVPQQRSKREQGEAHDHAESSSRPCPARGRRESQLQDAPRDQPRLIGSPQRPQRVRCEVRRNRESNEAERGHNGDGGVDGHEPSTSCAFAGFVWIGHACTSQEQHCPADESQHAEHDDRDRLEQNERALVAMRGRDEHTVSDHDRRRDAAAADGYLPLHRRTTGIESIGQTVRRRGTLQRAAAPLEPGIARGRSLADCWSHEYDEEGYSK